MRCSGRSLPLVFRARSIAVCPSASSRFVLLSTFKHKRWPKMHFIATSKNKIAYAARLVLFFRPPYKTRCCYDLSCLGSLLRGFPGPVSETATLKRKICLTSSRPETYCPEGFSRDDDGNLSCTAIHLATVADGSQHGQELRSRGEFSLWARLRRTRKNLLGRNHLPFRWSRHRCLLTRN